MKFKIDDAWFLLAEKKSSNEYISIYGVIPFYGKENISDEYFSFVDDSSSNRVKILFIKMSKNSIVRMKKLLYEKKESNLSGCIARINDTAEKMAIVCSNPGREIAYLPNVGVSIVIEYIGYSSVNVMDIINSIH